MKPVWAYFMGTVEMGKVYGWQRFYEAAILETNRTHLPALIQAAQAAIDARLEQLRADSNGTIEERQAIEDALTGLTVLRREIN